MLSHYLEQWWISQLDPSEQTSVTFVSKCNNFHKEKNAFENGICERAAIFSRPQWVNTLRPRQNGRRFPDDIFKCIFLNKNVWISIKISLKFIPMDPINNIAALIPIMAWRRPGDKPLSEPMMVNLPTHICVTRPQWVNDEDEGRQRRHYDDVYNCIRQYLWHPFLKWCHLVVTARTEYHSFHQTTHLKFKS